MSHQNSVKCKPGYWLVRWGEQTRISDKVAGPLEACKNCYGIESNSMEAKFIGTTKMDVRRKHRELANDPNGWIKFRNKQGSIMRCEVAPYNDAANKAVAGYVSSTIAAVLEQPEPLNVSAPDAMAFLTAVHGFLFLDQDAEGEFLNPSKEVSGADFIEFVTDKLGALGVVPEKSERDE